MKKEQASTWVSESVERTEQVAVELAENWRSSAALALIGPLGAGKTTFIRGLVEGLGGRAAEVRSPTYTLLNHYDGADPPVIHADLYRLESRSAQLSVGLEDFFNGSLVVVEWAEKWQLGWPENTHTLNLSYVDRGKRQIELKEEPPVAADN